MPISLNQPPRRHHRRLAALALGWLVFAAHGALAEHHMGDDMAACLAVAQTAALALAVLIVAGATAHPALPSRAWARAASRPSLPSARRPPPPRSRAGPAFLQVFRS